MRPAGRTLLRCSPLVLASACTDMAYIPDLADCGWVETPLGHDAVSAITGTTPREVAEEYTRTRTGTLTTRDGGTWSGAVTASYRILTFGAATDVEVGSPSPGAETDPFSFCGAGDHLRLDEARVALVLVVDGETYPQAELTVTLRDYAGGAGAEELRTQGQPRAVVPASLQAVADTWMRGPYPIGPDPVVSNVLGAYHTGGSIDDMVMYVTGDSGAGDQSGFATLHLDP